MAQKLGTFIGYAIIGIIILSIAMLLGSLIVWAVPLLLGIALMLLIVKLYRSL